MIDLFIKIYEVFKNNHALFENLGLEPVRHIDFYRGQPLNPEQFEYYDIPALFMDWKITWDKAGRVYKGIVSVDFHLVTDATWDTSNVSTNHLEGVKIVLYHTLVRSVLDNIETEDTSKLKRIDENPIDTGVTNYHLLRYQCEYSDPMLTGEQYIEATIEKLKLIGHLKVA